MHIDQMFCRKNFKMEQCEVLGTQLNNQYDIIEAIYPNHATLPLTDILFQHILPKFISWHFL